MNPYYRTHPLWRWVCATLLVILLIEFPRGGTPRAGQYTITTPVIHFQWRNYLNNLGDLWHRAATLQLGGDAENGEAIGHVIATHIFPSLTLVGYGLFIVLIIGVAKGVYDGIRSDAPTRTSVFSAGVQWLGEALPDFFLIIVLQTFSFFLMKHGIPVSFTGSHSFWSGTLVPAVIVAMLPTMYMARMVRMTVETQYGQAYLVTAQAKGLTRRQVVFRHLLPNCLPTVVHATVPAIALMLSNLIMVEYLMYRPGIVSSLFYAMGHKGFEPTFRPNGVPMQSISYYPYDPQLTLFTFAATALVFVLYWILTRALLLGFGYNGIVNPYSDTLREQTFRRRFPWQMYVGGGALLVVIAIGVAARFLPLDNPNPRVGDFVHIVNGQLSIPPFPPTWQHLFGTDDIGRDIFSRVLYGILPTFLHVAIPTVAVILLSTVLSVAISIWRVPGLRWLTSVWAAVFSVIPPVIAALLVLEIPDVYWFGEHYIPEIAMRWSANQLVVYLGVICAIQTGRVVQHFVAVLDEANQKEYMEAAIINGNSRWSALWIHHLRPLRDAILEQTVAEFSLILLLMSTLGFFMLPDVKEYVVIHGLFNTKHFEFQPASLDWPGLIAMYVRTFYDAPWAVLGPMIFIVWTILSLNLFLTGLRRWTKAMPTHTGTPYHWRYRMLSKTTLQTQHTVADHAGPTNPIS